MDLATVGIEGRTRVGFSQVIMGLGNGRFDLIGNYTAGGNNPTLVKSADLNRDNRDDLLVLNSEDNLVSVLLAVVPGGGVYYVPAVPQNLTCESLSPDSMHWSFEDRAGNEVGFRLYGSDGVIIEKRLI